MASMHPITQNLPQFSEPNLLVSRFQAGTWLDRRQLNTPSCIAISGNYVRNAPIAGGFQSEEMHFYDFCLAQRAPGAQGRLVDNFPKPQPLGEVLFVPAGSRYQGGSGPGRQRNMFVFPNAGKLREEDPQLAEILALPGKEAYMDLRCDRIRFLLGQISRELYDPGFASELMIEGLATTLLAETARLLQQSDKLMRTKGGLAPVNLRKIHERITEGQYPPSLEELAHLCNLSRRQVMRGFRESTGQTVGQFIKHTMLEKAQTLLRATDKPVGLIAEELGFVNASSFSTVFRRITGESPRAFRSRQSPFGCGYQRPTDSSADPK